MKQPEPSNQNILFEDASFTFPEIIDGSLKGRSGAYNVLVDTIMVNMSSSELTVATRVGHEVAHRLLAIDSTPLRLARHIAGGIYALIWFFLGKVAEYKADLTGVAATDIRIHSPIASNEAITVLGNILAQIRSSQHWLTRIIDSCHVVCELTAIEFGVRMLRGQVEEQWLESIERILVDAEAAHIAPVLYRDYPSYWLERQLESEGESDPGLKAEVRIRQVADDAARGEGKHNPSVRFEETRALYEDLFKQMYADYKKKLLITNMRERLNHTNFGVGSPLSIGRGPTGQLTVHQQRSSAWYWASGWGGPRRAHDESAISDAWRVAQLLELEMIQMIPEYYRSPMRMMTGLDFLLYEQHAVSTAEDAKEDYGEDAIKTGRFEMVIPGPAIRMHPSLITFLSGDSEDNREVQLNSNLLGRGTQLFDLETDWWRRLLLFETLRAALKNGQPAHCPLREYPIDCPADCPIKVNLGFLAEHSQLVAVPFCRD